MSKISNTKSNCKYFPSRDDKRYNVLFELFHKAVNENLAEKRKEGYHEEIVENAVVVVDEGEDG